MLHSIPYAWFLMLKFNNAAKTNLIDVDENSWTNCRTGIGIASGRCPCVSSTVRCHWSLSELQSKSKAQIIPPKIMKLYYERRRTDRLQISRARNIINNLWSPLHCISLKSLTPQYYTLLNHVPHTHKKLLYYWWRASNITNKKAHSTAIFNVMEHACDWSNSERSHDYKNLSE